MRTERRQHLTLVSPEPFEEGVIRLRSSSGSMAALVIALLLWGTPACQRTQDPAAPDGQVVATDGTSPDRASFDAAGGADLNRSTPGCWSWEGGVLSNPASSSWPLAHFNLVEVLLGEPRTLSVSVESIDPAGEVTINGLDTRPLSGPMLFSWGDGTTSTGWFPQQHSYANPGTNYVLEVTARYGGGREGHARRIIPFVAPELRPVPLEPGFLVSVPDHDIPLVSRIPGYGVYGSPTHFDEASFLWLPRAGLEYVLSVAASLQRDFANDNAARVEGGFEQVLLRNATFPGMYSLWNTAPVALVAGDYGIGETVEYASLFHEMGHNITLNSPASYLHGDKIGSPANAIFSESMAQIFMHATAYELVRRGEAYGLERDLAAMIAQSSEDALEWVRTSYEHYLSEGKRYQSWNDPETDEVDETLYTFMTIAYKFFQHAEQGGGGYRVPLKRMMSLLGLFDPDLHAQYDEEHDTPEAATFRSTYMVAAMSYAFAKDLRQEFRALNFPISDAVYDGLYAAAVASCGN